MAYNPTKILLYDLDANLGKIMDDLTKFQGAYGSLHERLMDLTSDTFSDDIQAVIDDLLAGYQNGSVHVIQRLETLKEGLAGLTTKVTENQTAVSSQLEAIIKDVQAAIQAGLLDGGNYQESFTYDAEYGNVTKHTVTGEKAYVVEYHYKDLANGELSHSVQSFTNEAGDATTITKTYTYDTAGNIVSIATVTATIPAVTP